MRTRGFTLIEILIMVMVGLILAAAAIPSFATLDDQRVLSAAHVLESDLDYIRARAIATGVLTRIDFKAVDDDYSVESPPGTNLAEPLSRKPWIRDLTEQSVDVVSAAFGNKTGVIFDGGGRPDVGGKVILQRGAFIVWVEVEAVTGAVTVTPRW